MTYSVIEFSREKQYVREFLNLPKRIYGKNELTQNANEERAILFGDHPLSRYFKTRGILVLDAGKKAVARAILTFYENDNAAYLGFFESIEDETVSGLLFEKAESIAAKEGCKKIIGPVDASIWIKYRLKVNHFSRPYTGEPYNKGYYLKLWQAAGYATVEKYYSNRYRRLENDFSNDKFTKRLQEKTAEGYVIKNLAVDYMENALSEIYDLMIELYRDFPGYKYITKEEFAELYAYLKQIVSCNMSKMAYYNNKAVGFFISVPDYRNLVYGKMNLFKLIRIMRIRQKPDNYVMLYMGVNFAHKGLGKAMAEAVKEELKREGAASVGALIREGNINKDYFKEAIAYSYEYVLLEKNI